MVELRTNLEKNKRLLFTGLLFLFFAFAFSFLMLSKTSAYTAGRLIDNGVFLDANSMNASQIQSFLVGRNSGLANMNFELQCYGPSSQERQWYTAIGAPCGTPIPASQIIYYAGQIYGVNPRVILATLQKEQSLVTAPNPTSWQLNQAMGYGCPTSGGCSASTFSYQIDSGTWALRYHYERARGNNTWWNSGTWTSCGGDTKYRKPNAFPGQNVRFYDEGDRLYTTIYIENAATSAFYCYTPHVFNNFPGCIAVWGVSYTSASPTIGNTGNCYTGSYNFVRFYELWFGSTIQDVEVTNDRFNLRSFPSTEDSTVLTTIARSAITRAACYQTGGSYIINGVSGSTWMLVSSPTPGWIATDQSLLTLLTSGGAGPCPVSVKPVFRAYNPARQRHFWTGYVQERDFVKNILNFGEGDPTFFVIDETKTQGKPVYRLYNVGRETHFWTTSLTERAFVRDRLGFKDEGYAFSVSYGGANTKPVWRLYDPRNERHFWTADESERGFAISQLGFTFEGEAFRVPR